MSTFARTPTATAVAQPEKKSGTMIAVLALLIIGIAIAGGVTGYLYWKKKKDGAPGAAPSSSPSSSNYMYGSSQRFGGRPVGRPAAAKDSEEPKPFGHSSTGGPVPVAGSF